MQCVRVQVLGEIGPGQGARIRGVGQLRAALPELLAGRGELRFARRERAELRDRDCVTAVPVGLEALRRLPGHGADREDVDVLKVELAEAEVLVADVAAAQNRGDAVGDELLVVHAAIHAREAGEQLAEAVESGAVDVGIEDPDLDVLMSVEARDQLVLLFEGTPVVEQHAHAHAAIGGGDEAVDDQRAGLIGVEDVVLEIERAVGELDEDGARHERVEARRQKSEAGPTFVRLALRVDPTFKPCQATKGCVWSGRSPERRMYLWKHQRTLCSASGRASG